MSIHLLLEQGIYFLVQPEDGKWKKLGIAPQPLPDFPVTRSSRPPKETTMPPSPLALSPAIDTDAFTAEARRETAKEAIAALASADWGPLAPISTWLPESLKAIVVVATLQFLAANPGLLAVAKLTPKQITAVKTLAEDAFGAVSAPLIGGWLRKLGPTLKSALEVYDPSTAEKGEATEEQLVNLLSRAMKKAVDSDDAE